LRNVTLFVAGFLLVILAAGIVGSDRSYADHSDGNLYDWSGGCCGWYALQQGAVDGWQVTVCSPGFPSSSQTALSRWNSSLNNLGLFFYSCDGPQVTVTTSNFFTYCNANDHACVVPTRVDTANYAIINPTFVYINPNQSWAWDGNSHLTRDVTHELGHVLGHGHYSCSVSLMNGPSESCWYTMPQNLDKNNYHAAYHADAVANLQSSSWSGTVSLTWNPVNIHNERDFEAWRRSCPSCGDWAWVGLVGKNSSSLVAGGQPSGCWYYSVWSRNWADYLHFIWNDFSERSQCIP